MSSTDPHGPPDGYVAAAAACERLGISDRTLRRRVAAGTIEGEYLPRPQGSVLYVKLPPEQTADEAAPDGEAASDQESAPDGKDTADTALLLDRLEVAHERERAQADRIAALERENGRLESTATHAQQAAENERQRRLEAEAEVQRLRERRWWRWW